MPCGGSEEEGGARRSLLGHRPRLSFVVLGSGKPCVGNSLHDYVVGLVDRELCSVLVDIGVVDLDVSGRSPTGVAWQLFKISGLSF